MTTEEVLALFVQEKPKQYTTRNTSHGNDDFREVILAEWEPGVLPEIFHDRLVMKIISITDPITNYFWAILQKHNSNNWRLIKKYSGILSTSPFALKMHKCPSRIMSFVPLCIASFITLIRYLDYYLYL